MKLLVLLLCISTVYAQQNETRSMSSEIANIVDTIYDNKQKWLLIMPDIQKYETKIREIAIKEEPDYNCFDDISQTQIDSMSENIDHYIDYLRSVENEQFVVGVGSPDTKIEGFDLHFAPVYAENKAFYFGHKTGVKCEATPRTRLLFRSMLVYFL